MKSIVIFFLLFSMMLYNGCEQSISIKDDMLIPGLNTVLVNEVLLQRNWSSYLVLFGISDSFDMKDDQTITVTMKNGSLQQGTWTRDRETFTYTCIFNHSNPAWAKMFVFTPLSIKSSKGIYELTVKYSLYYLDNDEPETGQAVLYLQP